MTDTYILELQDEAQWVGIGTGTPEECHQLSLFISEQPPLKPLIFRIRPIQADKSRRRWWPWRKS